MLMATTEEDAVVEAVAAGATGYLQKYSGPEELSDAVREVAAGRLRMPDSVIRRVFALIRGHRDLTIDHTPVPLPWDSKVAIASYLTRNFFLAPEKYMCLVVSPLRGLSGDFLELGWCRWR